MCNKSPTADLPESGLAATVNIQSLRPLDYGKERLVLTAEGMYDQQARDGVTPHLQGLFTDTFFNHRLGWIVAVDLNERNVDDQSTSTDGAPADSTYTGAGTAVPAVQRPFLRRGRSRPAPERDEHAAVQGQR